MDLILKRTSKTKDGIFGVLVDIEGFQVAVTLEHAYTNDGKNFFPKMECGRYVCVRGEHRLASMDHKFDTFEIKNVPGHTNILFHCGNYNKDSDGCVLLGTEALPQMIQFSRQAFVRFMGLQVNNNTFILDVIDESPELDEA